MSQQKMLQECDQQLRDLFPAVPRPEQKALAALVCGVVATESAQLSQAGVATPGPAQDRSKERRAQRLVANERLAVRDAQRALVRRVLGGRGGRVSLLVDATTTGATKTQKGTQTLAVALGWHGRAIPLLWRTWRADEPGQEWHRALGELFDAVQGELAAAAIPVVLADRGLGGAQLAAACVARGWHYLLRVPPTTQFCDATGTVQPIGALVPRPGTAACVSGVRLFAPVATRRPWRRAWEQGLVSNIVAVWRPQDEEPWSLVTDLPATRRRCTDYRHRTWEEELLRDLKSFGWNWQTSRLRAPAKVERLLLILALATLWMLACAQRLLRTGQRYLLEERSRRCYSHFQLGLRWVRRLKATDQPVRCLFHFWAERAATVKLS